MYFLPSKLYVGTYIAFVWRKIKKGWMDDLHDDDRENANTCFYQTVREIISEELWMYFATYIKCAT